MRVLSATIVQLQVQLDLCQNISEFYFHGPGMDEEFSLRLRLRCHFLIHCEPKFAIICGGHAPCCVLLVSCAPRIYVLNSSSSGFDIVPHRTAVLEKKLTISQRATQVVTPTHNPFSEHRPGSTACRARCPYAVSSQQTLCANHGGVCGPMPEKETEDWNAGASPITRSSSVIL